MPQPFTITERTTLHVRHRAKYFEVPMPQEQAFVFTCNGQLVGERARKLKEFVTIHERLPAAAIEVTPNAAITHVGSPKFLAITYSPKKSATRRSIFVGVK